MSPMTESPVIPKMTFETLYIDGRWVGSDGENLIAVESPTTEQVVGYVPNPTSSDMDRAVHAARRAFDSGPWPLLPVTERARYLKALADEMTVRAEAFVITQALEAGIPVSGSASIPGAVGRLTYYSELATTYPLEEQRHGTTGTVLVRREPAGVAGAIVPWNAPLGISLMKLAPALLAGCTMVLKASPLAPLTCYRIAELCDSVGLPPGVLNVLAGDEEVSESLVPPPDVDMISFPGSTATGRKVASACGEYVKRCCLELGGKSAAIVLEDADLDSFLKPLVNTITSNNGQACVLQSRVLLPRRRYTRIANAIADSVARMVVGDPMDPKTRFGPLISSAQRDKVEDFIRDGRRDGANILLGGGRPAHVAAGWDVDPTLFVNVDNHMRIAQEEIFGPVIALV